MAKAVLILTLIISLLPVLSASRPSHSAPYKEGIENLKQPLGKEKRNSGKPAKQQDENAEGAQRALWEEPADLENHDLFYGIGGQKKKSARPVR